MAEQQFHDLMVEAKKLILKGEKCLKDAAEHIAKASEQGASQRQIAEEIGRSQAWVCRLLAWRSAGYADETPFGPESKAKRERAAACDQAPDQDEAKAQDEANDGEEGSANHQTSDAGDSNFERWRRKHRREWSSDRAKRSKRDLLVKALGMLGSEHAGERASAALTAEKLRIEMGLTWGELIVDSLDDLAEAA